MYYNISQQKGDGIIKYFDIGKIINKHGLKGELKIYPTTENINRFSLLKNFFVDDLEYEIENVRYHKNFVYIKLLGINSVEDAEKLKGATIKISDELALPIGENEYYIRDLYGMKVYEGEEFLGCITNIISTGANDIYVVDEKIFIPAIKQCILNVDIKNRTMFVKLIEGLRDLNA